MRPAARRLAAYGLVGVTGVGVNLGAFWALSTLLHVHYLVAGPLAIELAVLNNYVLNTSWTFADRRCRLLDGGGLVRHQLTSVVGLAINMAVLYLLAGVLGLPSIAANACGIVAASAWNFALSARWTWPRSSPVQLAPSHA